MSRPIRALSAALFLYLLSANAPAQGLEAEPNDSCLTAQPIGGPALPFFVDGSLDPTPQQADVDFYRFDGAPGDLVQVDLEGANTGMGTLSDPFLGLFDADCQLVVYSDDFGGTLNSRLIVTIPNEGFYVLGATACCDVEFNGAGEGSYRLTLTRPTVIDSIAGRLVDGDTLAPLPGDAPPFAFVELFRCNDIGDCPEFVNFQSAGPDGSFFFDRDFSGLLLSAGDYRVNAAATGYEGASFGPFEVREGEARDVGDLSLTPMALIGAVAGRLVDALNGRPLPGFASPFAVVELRRCEAFGCYGVIALSADSQGRFRFEGPPFGLTPGQYSIFAYADDYQAAETAPFEVGQGEEVDVGDVALAPLPIRFGEVTGCDVVAAGSLCRFGVEILNRGPGWYRGEAWAIVEYYANEFPARVIRFQVRRLGVQVPHPQRVNLPQRGTMDLSFVLGIPAAVPAGSSLCVYANGVTVQAGTITGDGQMYDLALSSSMRVSSLAVADVAAMESFQTPVRQAETAAGTAAAGTGLLFGGLLLAKALFGSCPTTYSLDGSEPVLEAESFSYSIAPAFEARDVDRLGVQPVGDSVVLELRNEALETHYINQLTLLEISHAEDEVVYPDPSGRALVVDSFVSPAYAVDSSSRIVTDVLARPDGTAWRAPDERLRRVADDDFEDHIDLEFDLPQATRDEDFTYRALPSFRSAVAAAVLEQIASAHPDTVVGITPSKDMTVPVLTVPVFTYLLVAQLPLLI